MVPTTRSRREGKHRWLWHSSAWLLLCAWWCPSSFIAPRLRRVPGSFAADLRQSTSSRWWQRGNRQPAVAASAEVAPRKPLVSYRLLTSFITKAKSAEEVLDLVEEHGEAFNWVHTTTSLFELAYKHRKGFTPTMAESELCHKLVERHAQMLRSGEMDARCLSNSALAMARLANLVPSLKELVPDLVDALRPYLGSLNAQAISTIAWGLAQLEHGDKEVMIALGKEALLEENIDQFTDAGVANLAWALARSGVGSKDVMLTLAKKAVRLQKEKQATGRGLAVVLIACMERDVIHKSLFIALQEKMYNMRKIREASRWMVCVILKAFRNYYDEVAKPSFKKKLSTRKEELCITEEEVDRNLLDPATWQPGSGDP